VHDDARLLGPRHRGLDLALEVLSVRDEDHHLVRALLVHEEVETAPEPGAQRRARGRHGPRLDRVEEEPERVGVERQRHERVRLALEGHEAEAVAGQSRNERDEGLPGEEEAGGGDVLRGHGAGRVEHEHDVDAFALHLLAHDPPLRPREGEHESRSGDEEERQPDEPR
jgi:hypothetical protein